MMIKKIILITFIIFLSCEKRNALIPSDSYTYSNIIELDDKSVRSFLGIKYDSSWEDIAILFNTKAENIRANVLRKNVDIEGDKGEIILFAGDSNIEQISLVVQEGENAQHAKSIFDNIAEKMSKLGVAPIETIIENDDGTTLEKSYLYSFENNSVFFIVLGEKMFSLNISYAKISSFE